jgi:hypothetical protein
MRAGFVDAADASAALGIEELNQSHGGALGSPEFWGAHPYQANAKSMWIDTPFDMPRRLDMPRRRGAQIWKL